MIVIMPERLLKYVRHSCLTWGHEMGNKKSPLISLAGFGRACFYACFFTLCQAGMPNVLEEEEYKESERGLFVQALLKSN